MASNDHESAVLTSPTGRTNIETDDESDLRVLSYGQDSEYYQTREIEQTRLPRILIVQTHNGWKETRNVKVIARTPYLYVSYDRQYYRNDSDKTRRSKLGESISLALLKSNLYAYWIDYECLERDEHDCLKELCRLQDIIKSAEKTAIVIQSGYSFPKSPNWMSWKTCLWTLAELTLSSNHCEGN